MTAAQRLASRLRAEVAFIRSRLAVAPPDGGLGNLPPFMSDGRLICRPGDPDLGMHLEGIWVCDIASDGDGDIRVSFNCTGAAGWWRPAGEGERIRFRGQWNGFTAMIGSIPPGGRIRADGRLGGAPVTLKRLSVLEAWQHAAVRLDLCSALGKWTLLYCPGSPGWEPVILATIVPPDSEGGWTTYPDHVPAG